MKDTDGEGEVEAAIRFLGDAPAALMLLDTDGRVTWANRSALAGFAPRSAGESGWLLEDGVALVSADALPEAPVWEKLLVRPLNAAEPRAVPLLLHKLPGAGRRLAVGPVPDWTAAITRLRDEVDDARRGMEEILRRSKVEDYSSRQIIRTLKDGLALVSGLLRLRAGVTEHPELRHGLRIAHQRLGVVALVQELLETGPTPDAIDLRTALAVLAMQLQSRLPAGVKVLTDAAPVRLWARDGTALLLAIDEMVRLIAPEATAFRGTGSLRILLVDGSGRLALTLRCEGFEAAEPEISPELGILMSHLDGRALPLADGTGWEASLRLEMPEGFA